MGAIAALLTQLIPLIPGLIQAGSAGIDLWDKVKRIRDEDRSMSDEERAQVDALIAENMAAINDTSRDVNQ